MEITATTGDKTDQSKVDELSGGDYPMICPQYISNQAVSTRISYDLYADMCILIDTVT